MSGKPPHVSSASRETRCSRFRDWYFRFRRDGNPALSVHSPSSRDRHSGSRVCLMINIQQSLLRDVGVDLSCGQISMAEQFLHAPEIGPAVQQVGGKAVSQRVRAGRVHQPATQ